LCAGVGPADGCGARARDRSQRTAELLPLAAAAGVCVLAGSDVVGTVAEEVALLVEHGLSIEAALRAASTDARDYLGTQNDADIVTYDRDPREDPSVLAEPRAVVVRGVRVI
jgi:imidazolonepropionase-like amidohydrolase